jgi:carbamoyltransferase
MRIRPRHPWLGAAGFHLALPLFTRFFEKRRIYRSNSAFASTRIAAIREKIERGETAYLAGISAAGTHNTGVALVEVTRAHGPRLLFNNEEERFSTVKHSKAFPKLSVEALQNALVTMGLDISHIDAWFSAWDYAAFNATLIRTVLEEAPHSLSMLIGEPTPLFNLRDLDRGMRASRHLGRQLGLNEEMPLICTPHHQNHAWFSYATSPFARDGKSVLVAVLSGMGVRNLLVENDAVVGVQTVGGEALRCEQVILAAQVTRMNDFVGGSRLNGRPGLTPMPSSRSTTSAKKRWWLTTTMSASDARLRAFITKHSW